ncbi:acetyl-CoA acetyltransferase [Weissella viridescens]|uniref:acetyl-CoA C-acetyltransferase n=2 Tax=Weissella viridescens TaxID=1629 RepID=A0A0R2H319_WEIVI|nr:acetyl-CoA C-acetyltransferase [Weissella viridescens]KRN47000.1 acetyl-CoA C-acetyltransferase [Weissella viridescens]GEA94345.1 acetyl-CoA acetyltransferase [Weissella viridescens]SUP59195.1 Acetyl-CoA acetyltransferase [Weissella viridescens]
MSKVYIVGAKRTAVGKFGGKLATVSAPELGARAIKGAVEQAQGEQNLKVDQVIMGNVLQAGLGQNPARQASQLAGLGNQTPAITLNDVCGSGLSSVNTAAALIQAGQAQVIVAGGMENMSQAPYVLDKARFGYRMGDGTLKDTLLSDALTDAEGGYHMGITAENIADEYHVSREAMDQFAYESHQRALQAMASGAFDDEIVEVPVKMKKSELIVDTDEGPRADTSIEKLNSLRPSFKEDGMVTPGNASGINDGAAAVVLASEAAVKAFDLQPLAEWVDASLVGLDPAMMGIGPYYAIKDLMSKHPELALSDINTFELNEAFAAQAVATNDLLDLDPAHVNPNGGALALGHPVGASGARVLVTLINELPDDAYGVAALCIGGGMGVSALIKKV